MSEMSERMGTSVVLVVGASTSSIRRHEGLLVLSLTDLDDLPRLLATGLSICAARSI